MLNDIYQALDPVAFTIGSLSVRWYGLAYSLGVLFAAFLIIRVARHWKLRITPDHVLTIALAAIIGIVVGGRLGYVLFYGEGYYFQHPELILAFSNGGMSFHGGVLGMLVALIVVARVTTIPLMTLGDLIVIAAPVGLFMGRVANFINGELWGAQTTAPWGVVFAGAGALPRHPTQLYEALLEGVVLFAVLYLLSRKVPARPRGTFVGVFLVLYGVFRIAVEFVREPDAHIGYLLGDWLTMGMVLSLPLIIAGIAVLVFAQVTRLPQSGPRRSLPDNEPSADASDDGGTEND